MNQSQVDTGDPRGGKLKIFVVAILFALVSAAFLLKILQYYSFLIHDWDTGIYTNVVWNLVTGDGFHSDVLNKNHLAEHFSPIMVLFYPAFLIKPSALWLLAAQGISVGVTYVLVYVYATKLFTANKLPFTLMIALIFAIWAFSYPPLTAALQYEFHPSTLVTPFVLTALIALNLNRPFLVIMSVAFLILAKENAPLVLLGLGFYSIFVMSNNRQGLILLAVSLLSAVIVLGIVMPAFQEDGWEHYGRLGVFDLWQKKGVYLFNLLLSLGFLPLLHWRSLVCALPVIALNLSVAYEPQFSSEFHYDDFASAFLIVSAMHGLVVLTGLTGRIFTIPRRTATLLALVGSVVVSLPFVHSPAHNVVTTWPGVKEWELHNEMLMFLNLPDEVGVAAAQPLGPHLSNRSRYVGMETVESWNNTDRLKEGDLLILTPIRYRSNFEAFDAAARKDPRFKLTYVSDVIKIYEVVKRPES